MALWHTVCPRLGTSYNEITTSADELARDEVKETKYPKSPGQASVMLLGVLLWIGEPDIGSPCLHG